MLLGESGLRGLEIYILECNVCGKKFNNELSVEQYFVSENYRKREVFVYLIELILFKNFYEYSDIEIDLFYDFSYFLENLVDF